MIRPDNLDTLPSPYQGAFFMPSPISKKCRKNPCLGIDAENLCGIFRV